MERKKSKPDPFKLTPYEKRIDDALARGEYRPVSAARFKQIAAAIKRARKDKVLCIRINGQDLEGLKRKAKKLGVPYQTMVSELLHEYAA